ncbi:hypothetical protein GCM10010249_38060 [Streptomyces roseolilacinus]|uniref:Uncharacterized protein n=1 Tax=Streptomyces roseolilacinus TaxID=66904 RepID=A0A918EMD7_9ACTN|nr:hypothetical protein GCM10010249_38060 [Streptomyces roseolilacinus]
MVDQDPYALADSYFPEESARGTPLMLPEDVWAPGGILAGIGLVQARYCDEITVEDADSCGDRKTVAALRDSRRRPHAYGIRRERSTPTGNDHDPSGRPSCHHVRRLGGVSEPHRSKQA